MNVPGVKVVPTNSEDEVKGWIDAGERLLVEGGYDDAERIALLPTIIGLLSAKTVLQVQQAPVMLDPAMFGGKVRQ